MPVTTVSAAVHITPVVIKTFFSHGRRKAQRLKDWEDDKDPQDDIFFDQAFNIVKAFISMGTKNTVESLQSFTNTHVPAPYWAAVAPVTIPLSSCNRAADVLIDWFGPEELKYVVGGERWWQVRGLDGVDGEWITEKAYLDDESPKSPKSPERRKMTEAEATIGRMEHLETVMLYVHGGGYFWGSINTHRYQIIRYARKIQGRAFAVNYRKAPQYPWPCPVQDVLASYFYLIDPPPGAPHKPIPPSKIVFAGDSAGGGLSLTVLTVLRDLGLPMPAGAVLISPWVDLTHSFPSVMNNVGTDIIPQHGFLAKPSLLWPTDVVPPEGGRVVETVTNGPPNPGHADTLEPTEQRVQDDEAEKDNVESPKSQQQILDESTGSGTAKGKGLEVAEDDDLSRWEPRPPKVLMDNPEDTPLEMRSQIQMYATTEQLTHPLISPILQGSLGNLPPLYIMAGDGEVLRDEILYLAHRAALPEEYPVRRGALNGNRQRENATKFKQPTKVHLQVFDGMCHVLTVFAFAKPAKYAYRGIADFVKHITTHGPDHLSSNPFPTLKRTSSEVSSDGDLGERHTRPNPFSHAFKTSQSAGPTPDGSSEPAFPENEKNSSSPSLQQAQSDEEMFTSRPTNMIRERVDIHGRVRPMEPKGDIAALKIPNGQIGLIKEAPTRRWLDGQVQWDKQFKREAEKVVKQREKIKEKTERMLENARAQGLLLVSEANSSKETLPGGVPTMGAHIQNDRRWGPLDLDDENPPPSAIASRRDTPEALALLRKSIYHTAPGTHRTLPKLRAADAFRAAFDPDDDPLRPPKQSVSEQQTRARLVPIHGLRVWDLIVGHFMRETTKKATLNTKKAVSNGLETARNHSPISRT